MFTPLYTPYTPYTPETSLSTAGLDLADTRLFITAFSVSSALAEALEASRYVRIMRDRLRIPFDLYWGRVLVKQAEISRVLVSRLHFAWPSVYSRDLENRLSCSSRNGFPRVSVSL